LDRALLMPQAVEKISGVLKGIAAVIALFPGVAIYFRLVDIPPTLMQLVEIISFSISLIVIISVFLARDIISRMGSARVGLLCSIAVVLGAASITGYFLFARGHTVVVRAPEGPTPGSHENVQRYIVPLNPSPELTAIVDPFFGDYEEAIRMSVQRETMKQLMNEESGSSLLVMIVLLVLSELLLMAPVVVGAWKLAGTPDFGADSSGSKRES